MEQTAPQTEVSTWNALGTVGREPIPVKPESPFERPKVLVEWQEKLRPFQSRGESYFISLAVLTLTAILLLLFFEQTILAVLVGALAFVLFAYNRVEPGLVSFAIWTTGVKIQERMFAYRDLRFFWVTEVKGHPLLRISTYLNFPHRLILVLPRDHREEIENALIKYLPYHEEAETDYLNLLDQVVEALGPGISTKVLSLTSGVANRLKRFPFGSKSAPVA